MRPVKDYTPPPIRHRTTTINYPYRIRIVEGAWRGANGHIIIPFVERMLATVCMHRIFNPVAIAKEDIRFIRKTMGDSIIKFASRVELSNSLVSDLARYGKSGLRHVNDKMIRLHAMEYCEPLVLGEYNWKDIINMTIVNQPMPDQELCLHREDKLLPEGKVLKTWSVLPF